MDSDNTFLYFAYGMNTCSRIMDRHDVCIPVGTATLNGYHLVFKYHASIMPGGTMQGVLWRINEDTLASIDVQEGYPKYYDRTIVIVECNGKKYEAYTYLMNVHHKPTSLSILGPLPSIEYLRHIFEGYKEFGIPLSQLHDALVTVPEELQ